jgi:hypothetical protein
MAHEEIIISGAGVEAPTDNYEEFDQAINSDKLGGKLVQKNTLKGTVREYQLYASIYLLLSFYKKKKRSQGISYRVNLTCLNSEPEHNRIFIWEWLFVALGTGALAGLSLYLAKSQAVKLIYCMVAGSITLTASLICLLIFIYLMRDEYIFKSRYGNARLFLIENKKPTKETFNHFFTILKQNIDKAQKHMSVSGSLVDELKMCRYLRDKGIIDDETYTTARTAIFRHEQYKA